MNQNPDKAQKDWPSVIVAGGYHTGVQLMRNLAGHGVTVSIVDANEAQPCFKSRYGKSHLCPNPDERPGEWLKFMASLAAQAPIKPVLIASADVFVLAIARHASELAKSFTFCESTMELQVLLATKERQYEIAPVHGMPVSRTQMIHSIEEVSAFAATAVFPCILKPIHFREWQRLPRDHPLYYKKLVVAASIQELEESYRLAAGLTPEMVLQEVIEGPDTSKVVYLSCYSRTGERIGNCMVREIRTAPIYYGSASVVEPVEDPEADRICDEFLRSLGYVGLCEIELKRDSRDGRVKMIEANPRYSVTADAAPYAGVHLGWLHYLDMIGQPVTPVHGNGQDFRHIFLFLDAGTIVNYWRAGLLTLGGLLRSYRPPIHFFDLDWQDWRIALTTLRQSLRALAGQIARIVIPRGPAR